MTEVSSQDTIIVLVGGGFCILGILFLLFRICKKVLHGERCTRVLAQLRQCCCRCCRRQDDRRRTENTFTSMHRTCRRLESLLSKQPELIVQNADTNLRVGETAQFQITLPESRNIFQTQSISRSVQPHPTPAALNMSEHVSIEIKKITGPTESISFIREFSLNPETNEDCINVKYTVRESGFYEIHVLYQSMHVARSPHLQSFLPTDIDPVKTLLIRQSPTVVAFTFSPHTLTIEPKDRFGNICRPENFNSDNFGFKVTQIDQSCRHESIEAMTYKFSTETTDEWGDVKLNIRLVFEVFVSGYFQGVISYQNRPIGNPVFELVTLTPEENELLSGMLKTPSDSVFFKGKLLASNSETYKNSTDVFIYTSPKALVVKQFFFLNLLPYRLGFYRILPATKIELIGQFETEKCTFTIRDRTQPKLTIEMGSTEFRVLLAMFGHHLQQRLGGSESFENKQKLFHTELRLAREDKNRDFVSVLVQRRNLIESSMAATRYFGVRDWCRKFRVEFEGEEGFDDGGLRRELLNLLCEQLFENNPTGLFCSMGTSRLVHPNVKRSKYWTLRHFEFAGKVAGKCLFESSFGGFYQQMVNGRFTRSFLAHLIGSYPQHKHFEQDDPELHLRKVTYILENDVTPMELLFQEEEYDDNGVLLKTVDLIPNRKGLHVTNENKDEYLGALAQFRLGSRVQAEIDAFLKGLHLIIPEGFLSNFDENELEILMCGKSTFDVEDLKRNHVVSESGMSQSLVSKLLQWFWNCVEGMSIEERGRLLQFTTGSSLLSIGGFKELRPTFRITITNNMGHLPIAHTCFSESNAGSTPNNEKNVLLANGPALRTSKDDVYVILISDQPTSSFSQGFAFRTTIHLKNLTSHSSSLSTKAAKVLQCCDMNL